MIYKCLVVDDNIIDRDVVEMNLSKIDSLLIVGKCCNGLEAAAILLEKEIDIIFSDIDMPDLNGMDLLKSLKTPPVFIFISSYPEHAAESYNHDVIDFIVKPVKLSRIVKAVNKAIEYIEIKKNIANNKQHRNIISFDNSLQEKTTLKDHFYIKENHDYIKIANKDVLYIESMGNFSRLFTVDNKKYITLVGLKNVELQLPLEDFMRVHKQFIINLNHITSISTSGDILLKANGVIPLSSFYKSALMEIVNKRMLLR